MAASRARPRSALADGRRVPSAPPERTSRTRPRRSSTAVQPSTSPLTRASGPPATAATTRRSRRPVTGSAPKSTPPQRGSSIGWTRTAIGASTMPASRAEAAEPSTAASACAEGGLVADVEHGLEHAGHRGGGAVLAGGGRAHHDGVGAVGGHGPPRLQGAGLVGGRPAGGEHHAGERGEPGVPGAGQVGRLGPGVGRIGGRDVVERDDGGSGGRGHERILRVGADGTLTCPDRVKSAVRDGVSGGWHEPFGQPPARPRRFPPGP